MLKSHRFALITTAVWVAIFLAGSMALGASASVEPKVGIVDTERVYKEAPRIVQLEDEVTALDQLLSKKLQIRAQSLMLTEAEVSELVDLQTDARPKPAGSARIPQLSDLDRTRTDELTKLQGTQSLTDKQRSRLKELQDFQRKSKEAGKALYNDYQTQLQSKANEIRGKEDAELRAAADRVREAKGFVFGPDRSMVLSGAIDVTSDVISRLDRKQ